MDHSALASRLPDSLVGKTLAVLGGTGPLGQGIALRFAAAGLPVVIGSGSVEQGAEIAAELASATGGNVSGNSNAAAASSGKVVVVAVPWYGHGDLLHNQTALSRS